MQWSIVLHKNHGFLERCRLLPVPLLEESVFSKLALDLGVDFKSIFNPKGPASSSLIIPAHTSTPPPPCWCLIRSGALCPLLIQPRVHPSGPSRVTLIPSVHKTFEKSLFRYFLAQS
ncbi:protein unc-93-like A isoform X1%2C partial [Xyrichtys novacula]|uniref:Protein unc-93-like A isoform X1, partial n=1 Tax=Xyrichtys novacula TaxID=13765 RepID=A0AAV1H703_XYRNO|nr:protein unc-93-like A isoform X1%2C partial [Xyrichtys novacula]